MNVEREPTFESREDAVEKEETSEERTLSPEQREQMVVEVEQYLEDIRTLLSEDDLDPTVREELEEQHTLGEEWLNDAREGDVTVKDRS